MRKAIYVLIATALAMAPASARDLEIYFIDVEGGQSTLILTPGGETLLVDAGWPARMRAGANRVLAVAEAAGVGKIDYLLVTHYHLDHVGGVPDLAGKLPIGTYIDHGPTTETDNTARMLWTAYEQAVAKAKHMVVKPGDKIPLQGVDVEVVAARGDTIRSPLKGGGENSVCAIVRPAGADFSENARSVGFLLTYGRFRFADLADLTWQKENTLVCPKNLLGEADLFLVSNHSMASSNSPAVIGALRPRVAITNNGERTGASRRIWRSLKETPGFEDIWQLHYAEGIGDLNAPQDFLANPRAPESPCNAHWIKVTAKPDGSFTVSNSRNKFTKTYSPRTESRAEARPRTEVRPTK